MLDNIRVIEIGQAFSAPFATQILGSLGAEVIKVERPGGDETRGWGEPYRDGSSVTFHVVNRSKKSVVLDLKDEADRRGLVTKWRISRSGKRARASSTNKLT